MAKVGIAGAGPAGAYLAALLKDEAEVYEMQSEGNFTSVCAWGTGYYAMKRLLSDVGLNFDDYVFHYGKTIYTEVGGDILRFNAYGLSTFDKPRLLKDLVKLSKSVYWGRRVIAGYLESRYKVAVDATGVHRMLLGRPEQDFLVPTIEYRVKYDALPYDDFYIRPFSSYTGYLWMFPLSETEAFVGAGSVKADHEPRVIDFINKTKGRIVNGSRMGKAIRLIPYPLLRPIAKMNAVAVGEAAGAVFPMLGEGILPSMLTAKAFYESGLDAREYQKALYRTVKDYVYSFMLIRNKIAGKSGFSDIVNAIRTMRYVMKNPDVVGAKVGFLEAIGLLRRL